MPDDTPQETKVYMPSDQAKVLMAQNDEVRTKYLGSNFTLKRSAAFLRAEAGGPQRINTQEEHDAAKAD